ncbi:uncharacterized protein LOC124889625 [Capsicum annuum]|uniref:uncharacterized protein LOC124889625 n=1 Tax=Capsicum annuum TaxID=4072 RepID=UPI001FB18423|nr:uncharacterized protein LOC124889625 [Capsicum annuum]
MNIPLVEALKQMLRYSKFIKYLMTKKRTVSYESVDNIHHCSTILTRSLVQKKAEPGLFIVLCTIESLDFSMALCDLGASINLMSLSVYKKLSLGDPTPINMRLVMADRLNDEVVYFDVCHSIKKPKEMSLFSIIDVYYKDEREVSIKKKFIVEPLAAVLINFDSEGIKEYEEIVFALPRMGSYSYAPKKMDLDLKNWPTPPAKPSIKEPPLLELKKLPGYLQYMFLGSGNTLPMIIAANLVEHQVEALISMIRRYKRAIGWTIADIISIPPGICTHKIQLEEDCTPIIEHQHRLNLPMQEVVKKEIIK